MTQAAVSDKMNDKISDMSGKVTEKVEFDFFQITLQC
jgi:hypothetical protein